MTLTKEEKIEIINDQLKGLMLAQDISNSYLLEEKQKEDPSQKIIDINIHNLVQIEKQINILNQQITLLGR